MEMDPAIGGGRMGSAAALPGVLGRTSSVTSLGDGEVAHAVSVRWEDVTYDVDDRLAAAAAEAGGGKSAPKSQTKRVLHGVTGQVAPGQVVAILGPSGSGKTSMLNIIAGRTAGGVGGRVLYNGAECAPDSLKRHLGYVQQSDAHLAALTVEETLDFVAELRLPPTVTPAERRHRVGDLLRELDLQHVRHSRVGVVGAGISGGERRRLAIAQEIIASPKLLLCDEPTSGLDSTSALLIVRLLRRLAASRGTTVICSVHQPRASVFRSFDQVFILSQGRTVFLGAPEDELYTFLEQQGHSVPTRENPADFVLDLVNTAPDEPSRAAAPAGGDGVDEAGQDADVEAAASRTDIAVSLSNAYMRSDLARTVLNAPLPDLPPLRAESSTYIVPFGTQMSVVARRSFLHKVRDPSAAATQAANAIVMPILLGLIFFQLPESVTGADTRLSVLSLIAVLVAFMFYDLLLLLPTERTICHRENSAGLYSVGAFFTGRCLADLPLHLVFSFCLAFFFQIFIGFRYEPGVLFTYFSIVIITGLAGASFMLFIGSLAATFETANVLASIIILVAMVFDGNWIPPSEIPIFLRPLRWLSLNNYAVGALVVNELDGVDLWCSSDQRIGDRCIYENGREFLDARGFSDVSVGGYVAALVFFCVFYRFLAFLGLKHLYVSRFSR